MGSAKQDQSETRASGSDDDTATVLVVEDQEKIAEAYTRALATEYDVRTATGGQAALEKVDEDVDVVLLDRRMPEMSGDEVLEALKERDLPAKIAMVTAVKPDTDIVEMPFDEYLTKPAGTEDLHEVTEVLLQRARYDDDAQRFFQIAVKKMALESAGKDWTDDYEAVCEQLEQRRAAMDGTVDDQLLPENCDFH
jgi:DNA-binding response OmpR family regulator